MEEDSLRQAFVWWRSAMSLYSPVVGDPEEMSSIGIPDYEVSFQCSSPSDSHLHCIVYKAKHKYHRMIAVGQCWGWFAEC